MISQRARIDHKFLRMNQFILYVIILDLSLNKKTKKTEFLKLVLSKTWKISLKDTAIVSDYRCQYKNSIINFLILNGSKGILLSKEVLKIQKNSERLIFKFI